MNFVMRAAFESIKGQIFKAILAKLNSASIPQETSENAFFEKIENLATPYLNAFPKAVTFVIAKTGFSLVLVVSFFAAFSEALRQIDLSSRITPSAYLLGYITLFLFSAVGYFFIKAPTIENPQVRRTGSTAVISMDDQALPIDYSNVEQFRKKPSPQSGTEIFLNELKAERESFLSFRN